MGDPWTAPKDDIREAGQWQQLAPRRGTLAHSVVAGNCKIISTVRSTNMSKLYAYIMTTPINEVRAVGVWNVIVAFHRCVHRGRATESLAETAGGVLRHMETKWKGCHPRNVRHLIWAANLRMAGLRGLGGEEGFLATALNMHFKSRGPDLWHFHRMRRYSAKDDRSVAIRHAMIQESVRKQTLPKWIDNLWVDIIRAKQIKTAVKLNLKGLLTVENPSASGDKDVSSSRRSLLEDAKGKYEASKLPTEVWDKLKLVHALPYHLRPPQ